MKRILLSILALFLGVSILAAQDLRAALGQALERHVPNRIFPADLVITGTVAKGSEAAQPLRILVKGKDQIRFEIGNAFSMITTVFGKDSGWTEQDGKRRPIPAHAAMQRPALLPFLDIIADADAPALEIVNRGLFTIGAVQAQGVRVRLPDARGGARAFKRALDEDVDLYLDPQTLLILRSERWVLSEGNMESRARSVYEYSDYRQVQGMAIPFRIVSRLTAGARQFPASIYVFTNVSVNTGLGDSDFAPRRP